MPRLIVDLRNSAGPSVGLSKKKSIRAENEDLKSKTSPWLRARLTMCPWLTSFSRLRVLFTYSLLFRFLES